MIWVGLILFVVILANFALAKMEDPRQHQPISKWNKADWRGRGYPFCDRRHIQVGEPIWDHCEEHDKYYDKKTGEEVQVVKTSLMEYLDAHRPKHPCCKKEDNEK